MVAIENEGVGIVDISARCHCTDKMDTVDRIDFDVSACVKARKRVVWNIWYNRLRKVQRRLANVVLERDVRFKPTHHEIYMPSRLLYHTFPSPH